MLSRDSGIPDMEPQSMLLISQSKKKIISKKGNSQDACAFRILRGAVHGASELAKQQHAFRIGK